MEVRSCRRCKRLFNYLGGQPICPTCRDEIEKIFYNVKEYIRENPHAGIRQIATDMEVSTAQLRQWVREERLQFSEDSDIALQCENCGAKIFTGRYCEKCKTNLANNLNKAFSGEKPDNSVGKKVSTGNKMRFKKS